MLCCQLDISAFADLLYHALQDAVLTEEIADHGTVHITFASASWELWSISSRP